MILRDVDFLLLTFKICVFFRWTSLTIQMKMKFGLSVWSSLKPEEKIIVLSTGHCLATLLPRIKDVSLKSN